MIIDTEELRQLSRQHEGTLEKVPFAVLLHAMAVNERNIVLEIRRQQLHKEIVLEDGVPVDCRSNLAHETLGRFMVSIGRIDEAAFNASFAESCSRQVPLGDVLIEKELVRAEELIKLLQQNLARKLLDGFTWREGTFRTHSDFPQVFSPLKVNVAQLIMLGVTRFATQEQIDSSIGPLIGKELGLNPSPPYRPEDIRVTPAQQKLADLLAGRSQRIDELAVASGMAYQELTRLLYTLTLIGVVIPAEQIPQQPRPAPRRAAPGPGALEQQAAEQPSKVPQADTQEMRDELMTLVLNYRRKDPFDLLEVPVDAIPSEIQRQYLSMAERFAPWHYDPSLADRARDIFLVSARAYAELMDPVRRKALVERRERSAQIRQVKPERDQFRLETTLLDPDIQFKRGKALMASGEYHKALTQLEYAADLDQQNSSYRAELAYCRFLCSPSTAARASLDELRETLRIDPRCGLAHYYLGDILLKMGKLDEAEQALRKSLKPLTPDRRPAEALKRLATERKRRRR